MAIALALSAVVALSACDRKPSSPPRPAASIAGEGPTAASGGPPSSSYPAGIKAAPSGDKVAGAAPEKGPSEGGTAIGGVADNQGGSASGGAGAAAPTGGDGRPAPQ
ncbi:hypothetical protein [Variovorax sp. LT1R16]|uniref:hypothetical protein n=1 Tax=Variovorax sp. LT1R16 TaxID=3443728 RepID=UPI003F4487A4